MKEFALRMVDGSKKSKNKRRPTNDQTLKGTLNVCINREDMSDDMATLNTINTIFGGPQIGDSNNKRKKYALQIMKEEFVHYVNFAAHADDEPANLHMAISFTKDEAQRKLHPRNDVIVVSIQVANNLMKGVLIDNGSSADILFKESFDKMSSGKARTCPVRTHIFGFSRKKVYIEGKIKLPVTFRSEGGPKLTHVVEFLVLDKPSPHNAFIGFNAQ